MLFGSIVSPSDDIYENAFLYYVNIVYPQCCNFHNAIEVMNRAVSTVNDSDKGHYDAVNHS